MTEQEANKLPLEEHALQVCYAIEECGASPKLTTAVVLASALRSRIQEIIARTKGENRGG